MKRINKYRKSARAYMIKEDGKPRFNPEKGMVVEVSVKCGSKERMIFQGQLRPEDALTFYNRAREGVEPLFKAAMAAAGFPRRDQTGV